MTVIVLVTVGSSSATGCSGADAVRACGDPAGSIASHVGAIVGGSSSSAYLALGAAQEHAVVVLEVEIGGSHEVVCSGVLVSGRVVITARHCVDDVAPDVLSVSIGPSGRRLSIRNVVPHPAVDLAVLAPDWDSGNPPSSGDLEPLNVATAIDAGLDGHRVMLAGYGADDTGATGALLFATEVIAQMGDDLLATTGYGASGACGGDSGGPLPGRDATGQVVVLGILSSGSSSCQGTDRFVRLDREIDWLAENGVAGASPGSCGALSSVGRCFDGQAVWCEGETLQTESCASGSRCGWDVMRSGYRCVDPLQGCAGADAFGDCLDGRAIACGSDGRHTADCDPCSRCGFDPATGIASCF